MINQHNTEAIRDANVKRIITKHDIKVAKSLKATFLTKKAELGLTQVKLAEKLGMQQATVSQYLNATLPMNLENLIKFSKALQVDPESIDPKLNHRFSTVAVTGSTNAAIIGTMSGSLPPSRTIELKGIKYMAHHLAVLVDNEAMSPVYNSGSVFILDPHKKVEKGDRVAVQYKQGAAFRFFTLMSITEKSLKVRAIDGGAPDLDLVEAEYFPKRPRTIPIKDVSAVHKIVGIQFE